MPPNKEQRERLKGWLDVGKKLRDHGPDLVERVVNPGTILENYCNGTLVRTFTSAFGPVRSPKTRNHSALASTWGARGNVW
jgi:hypothetical protein